MSSITPHGSNRSTHNRSGVDRRNERGRRASIRSAIDGIQRFKQSWISIMVLKGGISLGQVTALITLLILASTLPSPLYPDQKQSVPSDACPHPEYFQAWMGVQVGRLLVCWLNSIWICTRRRRRESLSEDENDEEGQSERHNAQPNPLQRHITPSSSTTTIFQTPSSSDGSPNHAHQVQSPDTIYISTYTSTPSLSGPSPERDQRRKEVSDTPQHQEAQLARDALRVDVSGEPIVALHGPHILSDQEVPSQTDLSAARMLVQNRDNKLDGESNGTTSRLADVLDRIASQLSKFLGLLSFILFILGNVLLFKPLPSQELSCYNASPMLWWGVMTVTGVGWFLLAQMILVILVVGVGGTVVLAILRRFGITQPQPSNDKRPEPLTLEELNKLQYVCYVSDPTPNPTTHGDVQKELLPHPPIYLTEDRTTCAICQENYAVPERGREQFAEWLRVLGCGHVYHAKCIDEWLMRGSASCPSCNRSVRDMLPNAQRVESNERRRSSVLSRWIRKESR
ncbi:hypothetical protein I302_108236 [Kwoniella bestiolae CBS 10118]|uniref:RING-type domain-containing protein n=1 Tax=Kwoniella bestiolae CBS 10118 TaxID=1296100 RepID=A0A1B9FWA3_9TREE|nr:hypothetical protein I302_07399 [Kwoniella bestiolae CBS 10118]OCF23049.1 hypothetical protein I302_07399 [Kwoniella bestiolae CBS 10118]